MKGLLTIKEYAEIRHCSTTAVYKRLETTLKPYIETVEGKKYISRKILEDEGLLTVENKPAESAADRQRLQEPLSNPCEPLEKVEQNVVTVTIGVLERQLEAKDKELARLQKENDELRQQLNEAIKHNQEHTDKLAELLAQSQELNRNNQILLAQAQQPQQPKQPEQLPEVVPDPPKKKSWLERLFGE